MVRLSGRVQTGRRMPVLAPAVGLGAASSGAVALSPCKASRSRQCMADDGCRLPASSRARWPLLMPANRAKDRKPTWRQCSRTCAIRLALPSAACRPAASSTAAAAHRRACTSREATALPPTMAITCRRDSRALRASAWAPEQGADHASDIVTWLRVLRNDRLAIFTAAGHAGHAAAFLDGLQPKAEAAGEARADDYRAAA